MSRQKSWTHDLHPTTPETIEQIVRECPDDEVPPPESIEGEPTTAINQNATFEEGWTVDA